MREEQHRLRPDLEATITGELLAEMQYTRQVVKEVLRYRPPAPMVPQVSGVLVRLGMRPLYARQGFMQLQAPQRYR